MNDVENAYSLEKLYGETPYEIDAQLSFYPAVEHNVKRGASEESSGKWKGIQTEAKNAI